MNNARTFQFFYKQNALNDVFHSNHHYQAKFRFYDFISNFLKLSSYIKHIYTNKYQLKHILELFAIFTKTNVKTSINIL